jgi:hypothetical protein
VRTPVDAEFIRQATALRLRFACEDCAFFEPGTRACSEGYPNVGHRDVDLRTASTLEFCKSFELA